MRRLVFAFLLVFLAGPGPTYSFNDSSFREASTGGLLEDDFDLLRDPARIPEIDGRRVWTNLSNLVTQSEGVFDGSSSDMFLIGGSMSWGSTYGALVFDRSNVREPLSTGLLDRSDTFLLMGEGEREDATFTDVDGDGAFDWLGLTHRYRQAFDTATESDLYAGLAQKRGDSRLGLAFRHTGSKHENRPADSNYRTDSTATNLVTGQSLYSDVADGTGGETSEDSGDGLLLSYWKPLRSNLTAGGRIGATRFSTHSTLEARDTRAIDRAPAVPDVSTFNSTSTQLIRLPTDGWHYQAGVTGFYDWSPQTQSRVFVDVHRSTFDYGSDAKTEATFLAADRQTFGTDLQVSSDDNFTGGPVTGDGSTWQGDFLTYTVAKLSEQATFALGLRLSTSKSTTTLVSRSSTMDVHTWDNGDGVPTSADYTETATSSQTLEETTTSSTHVVSVPVGLEFKVKGPVMLRLGAVHTETYHNQTVTDIQTAFSDTVHRRVYGDGTEDSWLDTPSEQIPGTTESRKIRTSETLYGYGLGIQATENLQIDLMGFSDVTDLSHWRLSAVIELH